MVIGIYRSIITLNANGLNVPTKRHRLAEWIPNKTSIYAVYKRTTSDLVYIKTESEEMEKDIPCKWKSKESLEYTHMVTLSLIKEARIYSGEKTDSSISGAGKTGQLQVKELN